MSAPALETTPRREDFGVADSNDLHDLLNSKTIVPVGQEPLRE